jgi:hypothetical protein
MQQSPLYNTTEYSMSNVEIHADRILIFKVHFGI